VTLTRRARGIGTIGPQAGGLIGDCVDPSDVRDAVQAAFLVACEL
jgi:hypothetical protein